MFYTPDILCMRKKGKLARVWLAATLSERLFKQAVGNKALLSVDIDDVCANILRVLNASGHSIRFSLYLSSQLMYGTVKLFSYQVKMYETSLLRIEQALVPCDFGKRNKTKKPSYDNDVIVEIDLPEVPPLEKLFKDLHLRTDIHLLPEADYETVSACVARMHVVESPTFGELTDAEVALFLTEDFARLQPAENLDEFNEPIRHFADDTNQRPVLPPLPIEDQDFGRTVEDSTAADLRDKTLKTPKKREAVATTNVDTPTKRRRRNLQSELDATDQQRADEQSAIQPADFPADQPIDQPADFPADQSAGIPAADAAERQAIDMLVDLPANVPIDDAIPAANRPKDTTVPEDNNLHLEAVELGAVERQRNGRAHRRVFADVHTMLLEAELVRQIGNVNVHTVPYKVTLAVPVRRRPVSAGALLAIPSTNLQTTSEDWLRVGSRHVKWTSTLQYAFDDRTLGPFTAQDDNSMTVEAIRAVVDSRAQQMTGEISSALGRGLEASSRNKTTDEPSSRHGINVSAVPEIPEDNYQPPTTDVHVGEITNELIPENTGDAAAVSITDHQVSDTNVVQADTNVTTVTLTSDPETGDIDAFLPPKLRAKNIVGRTSHEKSSSGEAIVDIPPSPATSLRSGGSLPILCSKSDFLATIESCWSHNRNLRLYFSHLVPPESASRLEATHCFTLLLELYNEGKVRLEQDESYGELFIREPEEEDSDDSE